ncbi:glutamyl-tRNA synthetase [Metschnikowia bicuspidata var. bicuspidata NRRL YB-4993]|uniref:glutamate--tRNA ligase n=1 Tax=Metschnikowia bicuspidata var. bicuspidata NRRL YB-4993 TaxID=869754 RepID=A0A1A0GZ72_9ASCO|nr:glutamyl-tRNA synthetase [Metschnikowia bicuspidata var. bicuspidata NRRL YB-4993]OBA16990.1 glutamyl-tRNA synthetase [Metschnikowia bicuspidata var. bicuspidata NRRL YB-4993]
MLTLTVAAKAPFLAYASIIAAGFVRAESDVAVALEYVDDKSASASTDVSAVLTVDGQTTAGEPEILHVLASLVPSIAATTQQSDAWVQFALHKLANKNFKALASDLEKLDAHLNFRSFMLGHQVSLADIAVWGVLRANALMGSVLKNDVYINISRWYNFIATDAKFDVADRTTKAINEMRKLAKAAKGEKKESHKANFAIDLPNAEMGKVVTRFPPEPSGYLHIGHVKAAILNEYFAHAYQGKLIIRFDDTNPSKEKTEFQDAIIEDLALMGIKGDKVTFSSNYFDQMYDLAIQMIKDGNAYCDDTPMETMREQRMVGDASARRERTVDENLRVFTQEMKAGSEDGLKNCLRAKIDYTNPNKALRDPVIYRCNLTPHHRTGTQWKIYPTYDFCVPVVDSIEGVTHSLRTNEYRDRNPQYDWIQKVLKLRHVDIWDFGRVNFMRTLLSKRKLQWFVDKGYVANWDDPRFPTVRGVRRRGMTVEGLRNFILSQGPSKNIINLEWSAIWAMNKKIIDPVAPRHTAIDVKDVVPVTIAKGPESVVSEDKPKHKKNPDVGLKKVLFSSKVLVEQADAASFAESEEVTFMDWGNVIIKKIHKEGDVVKSIDAELHLEGDFRKTEKKVTWLADTEDKTQVELVDFDHLITKDKLEETDNFEDFITPVTEFKGEAFADLNVKSLKKGDVIQFERKGYYKVESDLSEGDKMVFYTIPDGKTAPKKK